MGLFGAMLAPGKPAPAEVDEITKLRAELARQKDAARLRARHGPKLTDAQVDELLADEADMVIRKAKAAEIAELNRQEEIRRDKAYRDLACELVRDGKMLISVNDVRLTEITPDLLILCPHCGKPLGDLSHAIYEYAKGWYWIPNSSYKRVHAFWIYSARSPLTESGAAAFLQEICPYCHERVMGIIQMVMI